jgi:hypothetical protein
MDTTETIDDSTGADATMEEGSEQNPAPVVTPNAATNRLNNLRNKGRQVQTSINEAGDNDQEMSTDKDGEQEQEKDEDITAWAKMLSKGKKKAPKETLHFTARKFCYVELTVSPPNHPVLGIRSLLGVLLANLGLEFPDGVALLPLEKTSKLKPIITPSAIPEKWSRLRSILRSPMTRTR